VTSTTRPGPAAVDEPRAPVVTGPVAWPGGPATSRRVWPAVVISTGIVTALLLLLLVRNHRYFFTDDRLSETIPKAMDIGRLVLAGEWPWLTTGIVNGSGYSVEYLNGVFNPLNVALYALISGFGDAALAGFVYVLGHFLLLTAATAWLGRTVGLSTAWSTAFAVSVGFMPYTVVWNASAWSHGVVGIAWVALGVAAAAAYQRSPRRRHGWVLFLAVFGTLTSGWPMAVFVMGAFVAAQLVARWRAGDPRRATVWLGAFAAGGAVAALVAVYPLLTAFQVASRSSSTNNSENFNVTPLEGLLQFANPAYYGFFNNWGGYALQKLPHFYIAWFALPVLVFAVRRTVPAPLRPLLHTTVAMLALSVLAALGPERLSVFRFPTRFIQYAGFFLLLLVAMLVAHGGFAFTKRRAQVLLGLVALLGLNALQADPVGWRRILVGGAGLAVLCAGVWLQGRPDLLRGRAAALTRWPAVLVVVATVTVLAGLAVHHPSGRARDHGFPHDLTALRPVSGPDHTLFYGSYLPDGWTDQGVYQEYHPATSGLMVGDKQVNGYSSLGNRHLRTFLPIDDQGNFSPGAAAVFTGTDPATGRPWLELLRVDQVVALSGPWDDELRGLLDPATWRREQQRYTAVYRHAPYAEPGSVSHLDPGVDAAAGECATGPGRECLRVDAPAGGAVQFARLWLPGYSATLDGEPVPVRRVSEAFVAVDLPPGSAGALELRYSSPGLVPLSLLALAALSALLVASARWWTAGASAGVGASGRNTSRL
jgi:hypothetical protein